MGVKKRDHLVEFLGNIVRRDGAGRGGGRGMRERAGGREVEKVGSGNLPDVRVEVDQGF